MRKISKILSLALVILAVITLCASVNAYTTTELINVVTTRQTINGLDFELSSNQKTAVKTYLENNVTDAQADAAYNKINQAISLFDQTDYTSVSQLSASQKAELISLGQAAADDVGLILTVNTENNTFTLVKKADGVVVTSGAVEPLISTHSSSGSSSSSSSTPTTSSNTLLYTGANYAVYAIAAVAIIASAIVVKKNNK